MRAALALPLVALLVAGCTASPEGRLVVQMSDEPNDIGDFASLTVELERILLKKTASDDPNATEGGEHRVTVPGENRTIDLTRLVGANATTVFDGDVPAGAYKRIDVFVREATGVLRENDTEVDVAVPSGRLFLNQEFTVGEGEETVFLFDVTVHKLGNGDYQLKPNAGESGAKGGKAGGK